VGGTSASRRATPLLVMTLVGALVGTAGCAGIGMFRQARESAAVPERPLSRPIDADLLRHRLVAQQPEWPTGRLPAGPGFRTVDCSRIKCVALTFDDGPGKYTARLLDILAAHNARATFFVIGRNITREARPHLVRMVAEGHEIGNHTWSHPDLTRLSPAKLAEEMAKTNRLVKAYTGTEPHTLRPPYGTTNARVAKEAKRQGLAQILWTIDTNDWQERKTDVVVKRVTAAKPGAIVLLHETAATTVAGVPKMLEYFNRQGYTYVTISELFGEQYLQPGEKYREHAGMIQ
jgi:peptidoglycan/xylan/chitin deacetylase (PgdA/CDA1 family)